MKLDIARAFESRKGSYELDDHSFRRIIECYNKCKAEQMARPPEYQASFIWNPIYEKHMAEIRGAMQSGNASRVKELYGNYFRENLSTGLHGLNFEMVETYMNDDSPPSRDSLEIYLQVIKDNLNLLIRSLDNFEPRKLIKPIVGNPYGYYLDENFISVCSEYHFFYSEKIKQLLTSETKPRVLELGGGFGGMAVFLSRDIANLTYVGIDLPENMALQAYTLMASFPYKKVLLYGEEKIETANLDEYDIVLMPNFVIEAFASDYFNLSYNSYSLAEMDAQTIHNYVYQISRVTKNYIYHVNHTYRPGVVSSDSFPWDKSKFELWFRYPCMWGKNLSKQLTIDEHEFIYKRKSGSDKLN